MHTIHGVSDCIDGDRVRCLGGNKPSGTHCRNSSHSFRIATVVCGHRIKGCCISEGNGSREGENGSHPTQITKHKSLPQMLRMVSERLCESQGHSDMQSGSKFRYPLQHGVLVATEGTNGLLYRGLLGRSAKRADGATEHARRASTVPSSNAS